MTSLEEAIRSSHGAEIAAVYKQFSIDLAEANGDQEKITAAEDKLRAGLAHAAEVLSKVRAIAKLG